VALSHGQIRDRRREDGAGSTISGVADAGRRADGSMPACRLRMAGAVAGAALALTGAACGTTPPPAPQETTMPSSEPPRVTHAQAEAAMESVIAEIGTALYTHVPEDRWRTLEESQTVGCGGGVARRLWGEMRSTSEELSPEAVSEVIEIADRHGYRSDVSPPLEAPDLMLKLNNEWGDTVALSVIAGTGSTFSGKTPCHPDPKPATGD